MSNNKTKMGDLFEDEFFTRMNGEKFPDRWDPNGDGYLDKDLTEVKCQIRYTHWKDGKGYMTLNTNSPNQVRKCFDSNVRLFFGEYDETNDVQVREVIDKDDYIEYSTRDGREMIGWPIDKMKHTATWPIGNEISKYSSSKVFKKNRLQMNESMV